MISKANVDGDQVTFLFTLSTLQCIVWSNLSLKPQYVNWDFDRNEKSEHNKRVIREQKRRAYPVTRILEKEGGRVR